MAEVRISGRSTLDSLARLGFEVAGVRDIGGTLYAVIVVTPQTQGAARPLTAAVPDITVEITAADTFQVFQSFDKPSIGIRATLEAWAAADPKIQLDSIGASVEGRPIIAVKVGPAGDDPARPNVLFMGTHHAREWVSTAIAMRLIRWLADSAPPALLNTRDVWVIPVENPDGYQYTFTNDRFWRKNRRLNADSTYGVDPNRNYPAFWGVDNLGSSSTPGTETYRGTAPASEPETQAIIAFHAAHPPVVSLSYHTYSGLVLYPYGYHAGELPPDLTLYRALAGTDLTPAVRDNLPESSITYYHPGPGWNLYVTNGEYTDWAYRAHGTIAFTTELTSGCCVGGLFYGFNFPDDSVLVDQVFHDNLPFAVALITAAGNLRSAVGASGLTLSPARFESLWPDSWLSLDAATPRPVSLTLRSAAGATSLRGAQTDSLRRGTTRSLWRTDLTLDTVRALRADGIGVVAELLSLAGAEPRDVGWTGWTRDSAGLVGGSAWSTALNDTLTSPIVDLRGRAGVWLHLWTMHRGSTYTPDQRGVIQFSGDSGATWSDVAVLVGDGPTWYPVRVDLPPPQADGRRGARVRFISQRDFPWSVDAVGFATDASGVFQVLAGPGDAEVSENPVRSDQVVISWPAPAGTGTARVTIYGFTGERLHQASVPAPTNEYVWDLTLGNAHRVVNGAYIIVVDVDGRRYRRRLFVARAAP